MVGIIIKTAIGDGFNKDDPEAETENNMTDNGKINEPF